MSDKTLQRIVELLSEDDTRKRIAAAVVLGELGSRDPAAVAGLVKMAEDPLEAYAVAALEALEKVATVKALPVLFKSLERSGEVKKLAARAIAALGEEALPEIRTRLQDAPPELRATLASLLPAVGGKASFEMALEGLRGQPFDAVNKVALSVRQEAKTSSEAEKRAMRNAVERFLEKKKTLEDEPALRGALKILGYLESPDSVDTLLSFTGNKFPPAVRMEAVTSLRFSLGQTSSKKAMKRLIDLMEEGDPLVGRAARDTLTVLKVGAELADELERLAQSPDLEVAKFAIGRLGALGAGNAEKALAKLAGGEHRARSEAATAALSALPHAEKALLAALGKAEAEAGAQVIADALKPLAKKLSKKDLKALADAGADALDRSVAVGRRILEPLRDAEPVVWADVLRDKAKAVMKKDEAKGIALLETLCRSSLASPDDRWSYARYLLLKSPLDPHPKSRTRDPSLAELERLLAAEFPLQKTLEKDKAISEEARFYAGFHFIESFAPEKRALGAELLEGIVKRSGRTKLGKAAKNKLALGAKAEE